ncbi:hypothetical protein EPO05_00575 [Patescibacteria group bacterium]|nr:MAG: hypothetical protein EPO05_00575 [Patescibacteria group bacterium]
MATQAVWVICFFIVIGNKDAEISKITDKAAGFEQKLNKLQSIESAMSLMAIGDEDYLVLWKPALGLQEATDIRLELWDKRNGKLELKAIGESRNLAMFKAPESTAVRFNISYATMGGGKEYHDLKQSLEPGQEAGKMQLDQFILNLR